MKNNYFLIDYNKNVSDLLIIEIFSLDSQPIRDNSQRFKRAFSNLFGSCSFYQTIR